MFLPSINGFHFGNDWPVEPVEEIELPLIGTIKLGDASNGLCGGMSFAVADYFNSGVTLPMTTENPASDSSLYRFIARRMIDSFGIPFGCVKCYEWTASRANLARWTWSDSLSDILEGAKVHDVIPLVLIKVQALDPRETKHNHQVTAYGCDRVSPEQFVMRIYDPNYPDNDSVTIICEPDSVIHSITGPIRGLYRSPYTSVKVEG